MAPSIIGSSPNEPLRVVKRSGRKERCDQSKIFQRINTLCEGLDERVDPAYVAQKTIEGLFPDVATHQLDELAAEFAIARASHHPDYDRLASRLAVSNLHKRVPKSVKTVVDALFNYQDPVTGVKKPMLSEVVYRAFMDNMDRIQETIAYDRDYSFNYFGFKTVTAYLLKINGHPAERPQHLYMRVAMQCFHDDIDMAMRVYEFLSVHLFTVASPVNYNAGTSKPSMSSCYLLDMADDSIEGIFETLKRCAIISKGAGGVGLSITPIRSKGSYIAGTNGNSNGVAPMMRVYNETARYVDQGGGKRPGAFATYMEPWHADIEDWILLKLPDNSNDNTNSPELYYAIWAEDEFFRRARCENPEDRKWYLMDPNVCKGLNKVYGQDFVELYNRYVSEGKYIKVIDARDLLRKFTDVMTEVGMPYLCNKTQANLKSNQKNIGVLQSSNLCVDGTTYVLTDKGHREIGKLAAERKAALLKQEELAEMSSGSEDEDDGEAAPAQPEAVEGIKVNVWNGSEYSPVEVMQTGTDEEIMTIETSFGVRIDCTPEHKFVLDDGSRVDAKDLKLGDVLPCQRESGETYEGRPDGYFVNYPGDPRTESANPYLNGFVMGYVLKKCGMEDRFLRPKPETIELPVLVIDVNDKDLLGRLEYDPNAKLPEEFYVPGTSGLRSEIEKFKHDLNVVYMPLTDSQKKLRWNLAGRPESREEWVQGFVKGLGQLDAARASHYFLKRCAMMIQSTGRNCHMEALNHESNEAYKLRWCEKADKRATIVSISRKGRKADVFCFTEPKKNQGVFNGQLAGQCTEIYEVAKPDEIASCNLSSVSLNKFAHKHKTYVHSLFQKSAQANPHYDFLGLIELVRLVVRVLNRVIDTNHYPLDEIKIPNLRDRPLGIGVQGLADTFAILGLPFTSPEAKRLNKHIFECIYYGFITESVAMAKENGPYGSYPGSPISEGKFQFDLCEAARLLRCEEAEHLEGVVADHESCLHNDTWLLPAEMWERARSDVVNHGIYNSLGISPMPTATTAQVLGNNESIEPFTSNLYSRKTTVGTYMVLNKHLISDLTELGLFTPEVRAKIIEARGSVQDIDCIPEKLKQVYKTVWEIRQTELVRMNKDRSIFIDQGTSFNWHISNPTPAKLFTMVYKCVDAGLKTIMYYLRSQNSINADAVTVIPKLGVQLEHPDERRAIDAAAACSLKNKDACAACVL